MSVLLWTRTHGGYIALGENRRHYEISPVPGTTSFSAVLGDAQFIESTLDRAKRACQRFEDRLAKSEVPHGFEPHERWCYRCGTTAHKE